MKRNIGIKICTLIAALLIAVTALFGCEKTTVPDNPEPAPTPDEPSKTATLSTEEVAAIGERLAVEVARVPDRTGTGIIIAADDESVTVVTCYHVAEYDAAHAEFRFNGDSEFIGGRENVECVGYSAQFDVAIFKVKKANYKLGEVKRSSGLRKKGAAIMVTGNAYGQGIAAFDGVVSLPESVASIDNVLRPVMRITAAGNPGNSGAPVLGGDGSLVGMVLGRRAARENENIQPEGMTYVLPIAIIDALCENAAAGDGNVAYTSVKFEWGDVTENNVAKRNAVVTLGSGEKATRIRYESGAFYKKTSDGNEAKIEKINGKDCPTDFINFVAEAVRKPAVELTIGGATENV